MQRRRLAPAGKKRTVGTVAHAVPSGNLLPPPLPTGTLSEVTGAQLPATATSGIVTGMEVVLGHGDGQTKGY